MDNETVDAVEPDQVNPIGVDLNNPAENQNSESSDEQVDEQEGVNSSEEDDGSADPINLSTTSHHQVQSNVARRHPDAEDVVRALQGSSSAQVLLRSDEGTSAQAQGASFECELNPCGSRDKCHSLSKKRRSESPLYDDEGQVCSICFESWTNSGEHRIAALRCGHLFGASCIRKWLSQKHSKCPQCNAKARRSEIRPLYAKSLKAIDTTERDRALKELEKEREARRYAELAAAQARQRCQLAEQEVQRLKEEIRRNASHRYAVMHTSSPQKAFPGRHYQFHLGFRKSFEICKQDSCRVMTASHFMRMLVINTCFENQLFPSFGVKKINTATMEGIEFINIHTNAIRDLAFSPKQHDGLLLTASMDSTVCLTNMLTNSVVLSVQNQAPVWSCTWNKNNPMQFYAGLQTGTTLLYDTRQANTYVEKLCMPGSNSPVVAIESVDFQPTSAFCQGGVIVGQLARTVFYESRGSEFKGHLLPIDGSLTSLRFEPKTRQMLVSCRPNKRYLNVRHMLCEMTSQNWSVDPTVIDNMCSCNIVHVFEGGNRQTYLSRSALIHHPLQDNGIFVCAGDEVKGAMLVWNVETGKCINELPVPSPTIKDICMIDNRYLAVLLLNTVQIYSVC